MVKAGRKIRKVKRAGRRQDRKKERLFFTDWYNERKVTAQSWSHSLLVPIVIVGAIFALLLGYAVFLTINYVEEFRVQYVIIGVVLLALAVAFGFVIKVFRENERALIEGKERESSERKYLITIINNLTDAVLAVDKSGRVLFYNAAALDLFDTNQSLTGVAVSNLLDLKNGHGTKIKIWDEIKNDERILSRNDLIMTQGGDKINLEFMSSPIIGDGTSPYGFVLMLRNITAEKSLEESKDEFIAVTGHELRTPIAIAEGSVSNLKALIAKGRSVDQAMLKRSVDTADNQIKMLAKIANDLLTLSRLDRGLKVPKETFDVAEFANETVEKYRPQAKEKGLKIRAEISKDIGEVETVKLYLAEILQNFITNAIKYTEKGEVVLKVFEGEGYVEFAVIDTGIGISKKDLANVFEKFYRSEDFRTMQTSGTGLGLYIVRRLADIMKAKLVFGSELNKGSTFGVQIRRMRIK